MKGKTKIKFTGGCLNGTFEENVSPLSLSRHLEIRTGMWFKATQKHVEILKSGKLDDKWICYEVHKYTKGTKDKNGYFEYKFTEQIIIDRCTAITQKGKQCMNPQYKNLLVCKTHQKKQIAALKD